MSTFSAAITSEPSVTPTSTLRIRKHTNKGKKSVVQRINEWTNRSVTNE
ncbi:MAG TPA: hypothetical protein VIJ95_07820 [Hanamia sp.]